VHATIKKGLADEQIVLRILFALGDAYFALCGILFLQLLGLIDGLKNSVAMGLKFQQKNIKMAEKYFDGLGE
jgi:hypothetical protein